MNPSPKIFYRVASFFFNSRRTGFSLKCSGDDARNAISIAVDDSKTTDAFRTASLVFNQKRMITGLEKYSS